MRLPSASVCTLSVADSAEYGAFLTGAPMARPPPAEPIPAATMPAGAGRVKNTSRGGWADAVARTGWSWGAAWSDLDLDGRLDLAVVTGHETRASVRDYERQFWWHDRFVAGSDPDPAANLYFRTAAGRRQAERASYSGWQANVLLRNSGAQPWPDLAWVWGLAEIADCRNLVVEDLDRDGRPDLVVTTQEEWPAKRQRLRCLDPCQRAVAPRPCPVAGSQPVDRLQLQVGTRSGLFQQFRQPVMMPSPTE